MAMTTTVAYYDMLMVAAVKCLKYSPLVTLVTRYLYTFNYCKNFIRCFVNIITDAHARSWVHRQV